MNAKQQRWVERRYDEEMTNGPNDFVRECLKRQVEEMPAAELAERLADMDAE